MTRRRAIDIEGFKHGDQPIPAACRVGNLIVSGGVHGLDPATGKIAEDPKQQCKLMFQHIGSIMKAAGASTDDIVKITVYMKDMAVRDLVNTEWLAMFPDAATRPARHTIQNPHLAGAMVVQCVVEAYVGN